MVTERAPAHVPWVDSAAPGPRRCASTSEVRVCLLTPADGVLQCVESMKKLCYALMDANKGSSSAPVRAYFAASASVLVLELSRRVDQVSVGVCSASPVSAA